MLEGSVCMVRPLSFRSPPKSVYDLKNGPADVDFKWAKSKWNQRCSDAEGSFDDFQKKVFAIAKQQATLMNDSERQEERYDKVREQLKRYSTAIDVDRIRESITNLERRLSSAAVDSVSETSLNVEDNVSPMTGEPESDGARRSFKGVLSELRTMAGGEAAQRTPKRGDDTLKQTAIGTTQQGLIRAFFLRELQQRSSVLLDATYMVDTSTSLRLPCDPNELLVVPLACGDAKRVSMPDGTFQLAAIRIRVNGEVRKFNARMLREPIAVSWRDSPAASFEALNAHDLHQRLCLEVKVSGDMLQRRQRHCRPTVMENGKLASIKRRSERLDKRFGFRNLDSQVTLIHAVRHFETYILPSLNCRGHQQTQELARNPIYDLCSTQTERPTDWLDKFAQQREALICDIHRNNFHTLRRTNCRRRAPQFALSDEDGKLVHDYTLTILLDELRREIPLDPPFGDVEKRMRHNRLSLPESDRAIAQRISAHNQLVAHLPLYAENFKLRARRTRLSNTAFGMQRCSLMQRLTSPLTARCSTSRSPSVMIRSTVRESIRRSTFAELPVFRCFASLTDNRNVPVSTFIRLSQTKLRSSQQAVVLLQQLNPPRDSFGFARARFDVIAEIGERALRGKATELRVVDKRSTNKFAVEKPVASWYRNSALLRQICQFDKQTLKMVGFPLESANCGKNNLSCYTRLVRNQAKQVIQARQRASTWDQLTRLSGSSVAKHEVLMSELYSVSFNPKATLSKKLRTIHQDIDCLHRERMAQRHDYACSHYLRAKLLLDIKASRFSVAHNVINTHERFQCALRRYLKGERLKCCLRKCAVREQRSNQIALQHAQMMRNYRLCMQQLEGLHGHFGLFNTSVYYVFQHAEFFQPVFRHNLIAQLSNPDEMDAIRGRLRCVAKLKKEDSATDRVHKTKQVVQAEIRAVCRKRSLEEARNGERTRRRRFVRYWLPFGASSDATAFAYNRVALVLQMPTSQFNAMEEFRASFSASLGVHVAHLRSVEAECSSFCEQADNDAVVQTSLHLVSRVLSAAKSELRIEENTRLKQAMVIEQLLCQGRNLLTKLNRVEKRYEKPLQMCSAPEFVLRNRWKVMLELHERRYATNAAHPAKFNCARLFMPLLMAELRSYVLTNKSVDDGTIGQVDRRILHERLSCYMRERLSLRFNEARSKFQIALGQFQCSELRYFLLLKQSHNDAPICDLSYLATLRQVAAHNVLIREFQPAFTAVKLRKSETCVRLAEKLDSAQLFDEIRKDIARFSNLDWSQLCRLYARDAMDVYDCLIELIRRFPQKHISAQSKPCYGEALERRREREFRYLFETERRVRSVSREIENFSRGGGKLKIPFHIAHVAGMMKVSKNSELFAEFANKLKMRNMFNTRVRLALANVDRRSCAWVPRSDPQLAIRMKISVMRHLQRNKTLRLVNYGLMDAMHDLVLDDLEMRHVLRVRNAKLKLELVRKGETLHEGWKRTAPLFAMDVQTDEVISQTNLLLRGIVTALRSNTALGIYVSLSDALESLHEIFERSESLTQVHRSLLDTWPLNQLSSSFRRSQVSNCGEAVTSEPATSSYESYWADSQLIVMTNSSELNAKRNRDALSIVDENAFEEKLYRIWRVEDRTDEFTLDLSLLLAVRSEIKKLRETPFHFNMRLGTDKLTLNKRLLQTCVPSAFVAATDNRNVDVSIATFWLKVRVNEQFLRNVRGSREPAPQSIKGRSSVWKENIIRFFSDLPNALVMAAKKLHARNSEHLQSSAVVRLLDIIGRRQQVALYGNASADFYFDSVLQVRLRLTVHSEFDAVTRLKLTESIKAVNNSPLYGRLDHLLHTRTEQRAFRLYVQSIRTFDPLLASNILRCEQLTFGMFRVRKRLHEQISTRSRVSASSQRNFVWACFEHLLAHVKQSDALKLKRWCNPFVKFTRIVSQHLGKTDQKFLDEMVLRRHDNVVRSLKQERQCPMITHNQQWHINRARVFRRALHGKTFITAQNCAFNRLDWIKKVRQDCEAEQRARLTRVTEKSRGEGVKLRISGWPMMQVLTELQAKHRLALELAVKPTRLNTSGINLVHLARQPPNVAQHQALQSELRLQRKKIARIAREKGRCCIGIFQRKHTSFAHFVHSSSASQPVMHNEHSIPTACDVLFAIASLKERLNEQIVSEFRRIIRNGRLLNSDRISAQRFWSSVFERLEVGYLYTEANMQYDVCRTYRIMATHLSVKFDEEQMARLRIRARINRQLVTFDKRTLTHIGAIRSLPDYFYDFFDYILHLDSPPTNAEPVIKAGKTKLELYLLDETTKLAVRAKHRLCASVETLSLLSLKGLRHVEPIVKNLRQFAEEMPLSDCRTYRPRFDITVREVERAATRTRQVSALKMTSQLFHAAKYNLINRASAEHLASSNQPEMNLRSRHSLLIEEEERSMEVSQSERKIDCLMLTTCQDITRFRLSVFHAARLNKHRRASFKAAKLRGSAEITSADVTFRDVMIEMIGCATKVHDRSDESVKRSLVTYFKYYSCGQSFFGHQLDEAVIAKQLVNRALIQNSSNRQHKAFVCCVATRMLSAGRNKHPSFTGGITCASNNSFAKRNKFELYDVNFRRDFDTHSVSLNNSLHQIAGNHYLRPSLLQSSAAEIADHVHCSRSRYKTSSSLTLKHIRRGTLLRDSFNETSLNKLRETMAIGEVVCGLYGLTPRRKGDFCEPGDMARVAYQIGLAHNSKQNVASELIRMFRTGKMHLGVRKPQECAQSSGGGLILSASSANKNANHIELPRATVMSHSAPQQKDLRVKVAATFAGQPLNIRRRTLEQFFPLISYKSISDHDEVAFRKFLVTKFAKDAPASFFMTKFRDSLCRKSFDDVTTLDLSRCARFAGMSPSEIESFFNQLEKHAIYADRLIDILDSLKLPSQIQAQFNLGQDGGSA